MPGGKASYADYDYVSNEFNQLKEFINEKELCDYIEQNIKAFVNDTLEIEYVDHERESYITPFHKPFGGNKSRIDFLVTTTNNEKVLIEVKNPAQLQRELNRAAAQMLDYIIVCEESGYKVHSAWLVISKINPSLIKIIKRFNLPINICVFSKNNFALWWHDRPGCELSG